MTTEERLVTPEIEAAVNRESEAQVLEVERGAIRQFARSAGYTNPVYYNLDAARAAGHPDLPCPPGFLGRYPYEPGKSNTTFSNPLRADTPTNPKLTRGLNGGMWTRL